MKILPSVVVDAPAYYVDHFNGTNDTDKVVIIRDQMLELDFETESASFGELGTPTHVLDLTNNQLQTVPNLSRRKDIHTLLLARNHIYTLTGMHLPKNLKNLVLAHNRLSSFVQLLSLKNAPTTLRNLVLRGNQVCHLENYRTIMIKLVPQLSVLDFIKISKEERSQADRCKLADMVDLTLEKSQQVKGASNSGSEKSFELMKFVFEKLTPEKRKELKLQLANATSLEEMERIEKLLSGGL